MKSSEEAAKGAAPKRPLKAKIDRTIREVYGGGPPKLTAPPPAADWRDKRPLMVAANWAIPISARGKRDLALWADQDVERMLITYTTTDGTLTPKEQQAIERKIKFLSKSTRVDIKVPMELSLMDNAVASAAAGFSAHRTKAKADKCIVRQPSECFFPIPRTGIAEALERIAKMDNGLTAIQKMQALENFGKNRRDSAATATTVTNDFEAASDGEA
mmetsp:Transcript_27977/g.94218  ORF Transcript_27977/g.94218 Transcript_27977/m.94218 type:complete len:216 (+) Transcript_27977:86-733(+)